MLCPLFERELIEDGIILIKYFFDVTREEQERRFHARIEDPRKRWKLSPMDLESWARVVGLLGGLQQHVRGGRIPPMHRGTWSKADDKRRARLNCISHLLSLIPLRRDTVRTARAAQAQNASRRTCPR